MGHDIYAYIKEKNSEEKEEVAYFRISAFNYVRINIVSHINLTITMSNN